MSNMLNELMGIFEVEKIDLGLNFSELEEWDSLNALVLVGYLEDEFDTVMSAEELLNFPTIGDFLGHFDSK